MKLFFAPGACSLSPHITLLEAGLKFDTDKVDFATKTTASGADFNSINPKGYVPTLMLDDGQVLTEGPAIVQYIADQAPLAKLAPAPGTIERYRLQEWLGFINSEIHKQYSPLFNAKQPPESKEIARGNLARRYGFIDKSLGDKPYLMGDQFTVADAYLFTVTNWAARVNLDLTPWPKVMEYMKRVAARPAVHAAMIAEGLVKA